MRSAFVGFDSAWSGKQGGICFALFEDDRLVDYRLPAAADFDHARSVIRRCQDDADYTLVAVDQPTMVPNATGMRPVERVASTVKGGVQPANLNGALFSEGAPIWTFLDNLSANENPHDAQCLSDGLHVIEVFPGLALPALLTVPPLKLPQYLHYNPQKTNFVIDDWKQVADSALQQAERLKMPPFVKWAMTELGNAAPTKADQDCLDALICLVIALKWRRGDTDTMVLGDWRGYMVTPLSAMGKARVTAKAEDHNVPVGDGSWGIYEAALAYFDGKHYDAFEWLGHPSAALGGETPLDRAKKAEGTQDVLDLIGRLEHGIPT